VAEDSGGPGSKWSDVPYVVFPGNVGDESALLRVEQMGEVFDLPLSVAIEYADGHSEELTLSITEALTERRIPLKGPVRRIAARDPLTLATYLN